MTEAGTDAGGGTESIAELRAEAMAEVIRGLDSVAPDVRGLAATFAYGMIWSRPQLGLRERSIATIAALVASDCPDELKSHVLQGLQNGITKAEIGELLTHLVPYTGFPAVVSSAAAVSDLVRRADVGPVRTAPST